jgi:hypothetical protein
MKKITLLLILAFAFVATSSAAPLCTTFATVGALIGPGIQCEAGNLMFANFSWTKNGTSFGNPNVAASAVPFSVVSASATSVTLKFGDSGTFATASSTTKRIFSYNLVYTAATILPGGYLSNVFSGSIGASINPGLINHQTGAVNLVKDAMDGFPDGNLAIDEITLYKDGTGVQNLSDSSPLLFSGLTFLATRDTIDIQNKTVFDGQLAQAIMNSFTQTFNNTLTVDHGDIPEPLTLVLMGSGLLGLGLLRKRVASK